MNQQTKPFQGLHEYLELLFKNFNPNKQQVIEAKEEYKKIYPDWIVYFHITNQNRILKMDYRNSLVEEVPLDAKLEQPYIKLSMDATLFCMLLINHISWNTPDSFIDYERVPNVFDQQAYILLNHLRI